MNRLILIAFCVLIAPGCHNRTVGDEGLLIVWPGQGNSICASDVNDIYVVGYNSHSLNNLQLSVQISNDNHHELNTTLRSNSYIDGFEVLVDGEWLYVAGRFSRDIVCETDDGMVQHLAESKFDSFLVKMDPDGNIAWIRVWPTMKEQPGWTDDFTLFPKYDLAVDNAGNIYVGSEFNDTVDFDPGPETTEYNGNNDFGSVFITSFNSHGTFRWAKSWDASFGGMCVDDAGNLLVSGSFINAVDLNPGPEDLLHGSNYASAFLRKFDADGNLDWSIIWARLIPDAAFNFGSVGCTGGVTLSPEGNVITIGYFSGTVDFDPSESVQQVTASNGSMFLSEFSNQGMLLMKLTWEDKGSYIIHPWPQVVTDENGNILLLGTFNGTIDMDPGPGEYVISSQSMKDIFLVKLDPEGKLTWVRTWGDSGNDYGMDLCVDANGIVYVTGSFSGDMNFGERLETQTDWDSVGFVYRFLPDGTM